MRTQSICLALVIVLLCPYVPAQWVKTNGPNNGNINCFAVSGTDLFVGTGVGVYRSTNSGSSWTSSGLTNTIVRCFAVGGTNLFAGAGGGVFLTTDNGTSWTAASTGLPTEEGGVTSLIVSGTNLFGGTGVGVYRSTNGGSSWTSSGLTNTIVHCFAVGGTNLFAGAGGGVFLSTDNGTSWTARSNVTEEIASVGTLAMSGTNLVAAYKTAWYNGVVLSSDNGWSWNGLYVGLTNTDVRGLAFSGTNLFAGTWGGVFLSSDNFKWTAVSTGLTDTLVNALAVSGSNLFAGTYGGWVWRRPLSEMITGVESTGLLPISFVLDQNFPNPFNPSTVIRYGLPHKSAVQLAVFNTLGQRVAVLQNGEQEAGYHEVRFDASGLSSGVYFYRLQAGDFVQTRKLLLLR